MSGIRLVAMLVLLAAGCHERRERDVGDEPVRFAAVQPLLARACVRCHGEAPAAGYRVDSYYAAIGCGASGAPVTKPADARAPLLAVLGRADHAGLLTEAESALLARWVRDGAERDPGTVHEVGILDPRSDAWHGKLAAVDGWSPLRDAEAPAVCGRCHDGSPVRPEGVQFGITSAPACTTCHESPAGVLDCTTCHGAPGRAYPPRDACYVATSGPDLHGAHVMRACRIRATPLACGACHPAPGEPLLSAAHANGTLDLALDPALAGEGARFDAARGTCLVACHARGGTHPEPVWTEPRALDCNGCHLSPPADHYPGACASCHREMGATADSLRPGPLHLDGEVELGSGTGTCGACHGDGVAPWPGDALHTRHRTTALTTPLACESCHVVPATVIAPGHLDGQVTVLLSGRAQGAGAAPRYEASEGRCDHVACHRAGLRVPSPSPRWREDALGASGRCEGCHRAPPPPPHVQMPTCAGGLCHGAEVSAGSDALGITEAGRALHLDGDLDVGSAAAASAP